MKGIGERLYNGIVKENPTFVLMLGMCPTLAVTTSAKNGLGMGFATMAVLILSNFIISLLRKIIPEGVRVPVYITIIASFVTIIEMVMHAFVKPLYDSLGIFIPLIVVNCIILGRAEAYANKNNALLSIFDGVGIGLGFTIGLTTIGIVRELLGNGTIFGFRIMPKSYEPVAIFIMAPGAFLILALLCALQNKLKLKGANRHVKGDGGCSGDCASCPMKEVENDG
ncbi:MAG: electron transport complex subunit E [Eubacterium sp.]|jgi:electron transport complex protein RnfE|nr:electron transport complex subunit E [Eubacterium sp.]